MTDNPLAEVRAALATALRTRAEFFRRMDGNLGYYSAGDARLDENAAAALSCIEQAGVEMVCVKENYLRRVIVEELLGFFDDPRASAIALAELEARHAAGNILARLRPATEPEERTK